MSDNINRQLTINLTLDRAGLSKLADALVLLAGTKGIGNSVGNGQQVPAVQGTVLGIVPPGSPVIPPQMPVSGMPQPAALLQNPGTMQPVPSAPYFQPVPNPGQNIATPQPGPVPTTAVAQNYSYDQLAVAAAGLVNQGKQQKLHDILHSFGVNAMTELPRDKYGDFATAMKAEGAVV